MVEKKHIYIIYVCVCIPERIFDEMKFGRIFSQLVRKFIHEIMNRRGYFIFTRTTFYYLSLIQYSVDTVFKNFWFLMRILKAYFSET